ncbi:MAG: GlxA family transcriptional regulator [Rhizobiaceae bacterium]
MIKSASRPVFGASAEPLDVTFLVMSGLSISCVSSAVDPLRAANRVTGRTVFSWRFVSSDGKPAMTTCGLPIAVSGKFDADVGGDMLIVIAGFDTADQATQALLSRVSRTARRVSLTGGIEAGSWVLARAGLLAGRRATTHWEDFEDFASANPEVDVLQDRYVIDGNIFTTGGASPTFDLMTHLIRARLGVATALDVASVFIYEEGKEATDTQPLVAIGPADRYDPRFAAAVRLMESRIDRPLTTAAIARRLKISVRSLENLFQAAISETPGAYYLRLRLSIARRMVTDTRTAFSEIAERSGFSSPSSFSRAFAKHYGSPPATVRRNHTRSMAIAIP